MHIDIVVYPGFDELDAIAPYEVFVNAGRAGGELTTRLVARETLEPITASHGLTIHPEAVFVPGADVVLVPGGSWVARNDIGAWGEVQRGDWLPILKGASEHSIMAAVCTGSMLLAYAAVIGDRRATTHHSAWDDLVATGATLVKDRVVDDGDLVTAGGVTSGLDLALWLVERFCGPAVADAVGVAMEYDRWRP